MSARGPLNLRRWLGCGVKETGKLGYRRKFSVGIGDGDFIFKTVHAMLKSIHSSS